MEEVKWIKINPKFLDGSSFKFIRKAKIDGVTDFRDKLEAVWFELLGLAGQVNNNGFFYNDEIAYSSYSDIAIMLDRTDKEIEICMNFYVSHKMVEIIDNCYCLSNWAKYQNTDGLEKIKEQTRKRVAEYRERKKLIGENGCNATCNVTETLPSQRLLYSYSNSNNNINSNSIDKEENKIKEEKHKYGQYGRILLTDKQYKALCDKHSKAYIDEVINKVDEYVQMNGNKNKYKDFNLVIQKAIRDKWSCVANITIVDQPQEECDDYNIDEIIGDF